MLSFPTKLRRLLSVYSTFTGVNFFPCAGDTPSRAHNSNNGSVLTKNTHKHISPVLEWPFRSTLTFIIHPVTRLKVVLLALI